MSKTAQRREAFYQQGFNDRMKGRGHRWAAHPFLREYKNGWKTADEQSTTQPTQPIKLSWWRKLLAKLF